MTQVNQKAKARAPQLPVVGVRLPADLRAYVEAEAKKNFRALSAEIAARVERTRQHDQQGAAK